MLHQSAQALALEQFMRMAIMEQGFAEVAGMPSFLGVTEMTLDPMQNLIRIQNSGGLT